MPDAPPPVALADAGGKRIALARRASSSAAWRLALGLAATAAAGSWIGYYLVTKLPFIELETFRATVTLHVVTGAVFIPYLLSLVARRRLPGGSILDAPLIALLGAYVLATASSENWRLSLEVMLTVLMAIGVFYVLSDGGFLTRAQLEAAFMLAVLAAAVWALWLVGEDYLAWLRLSDAVRDGRSFGDLFPPTVPPLHDVGDHKNLLGGILAMGLPFFVVLLLRQVPLAVKALAAVAVLALGMAVFLSLARSAWLAAAVGVAMALVLATTTSPRGREWLRHLWPRTPGRQVLVGGVALALAGAVIGVAYLGQATEARPLWLFRESGSPRLDTMGAGAEMLQDYPLLGTGPGVYALLYPEYSGRHPNHAFHSHNGYLQAAVDMGVPGIAAMALLAAAISWLLCRSLRVAGGGARLSLIGAGGALAAFATFSLFDAPNEFKGPLVALAAAGAIAALAAQDTPAPRGSATLPALDERWLGAGHLAARAIVPAALVGLLVAWARLDVAHFEYSTALSNANAGELTEAVEGARFAVDLDPHFSIYRLQLGTVLGRAYLRGGGADLLDEARRQLARAIELEPRGAIAYANLALLEAEANDRERARVAAEQALRFANSDAAVVLAAGSALEAANWGDEAVAAYAQALFLDAGLADSPFWDETPFRRTRYADVIAQSALVFNPCALLRLAVEGAPEGPITRDEAFELCSTQLFVNPGALDGRVSLALALIGQGELDDALEQIDYVLDRQPDNPAARTAYGRWFEARGELERAREQWLIAAQLEDVDGIVLLGDSYPAGEVPEEVVAALRRELRESASQVQFHLTGILYYRFKFFRASPVTILLPGDWQDAVPARHARALDALGRWTGGR